MNRQFKLNNPVVEKLLDERCAIKSDKQELNEFFLDPISMIIKALLGGTEPEAAPGFVKTPQEEIDPKSLQISAPSVRYSTAPGFQLSRASTIA